MSQKQYTWQDALSTLVTDPKELWDLLALDPALLAEGIKAAQLFPLKVTRSFIARMEKENINDPLLRQVLPLGIEAKKVPGYEKDPLQESTVNPVPGLLHKYHGRVLVTLTSACAVHCRYCFRRYFPYAENNPGRAGWDKIFDYIRQDETIKEVILSGGDPLAVSDEMLQLFVSKIEMISHIRTLRIHTRMPVVLPERITNVFLSWASRLKLRVIMVVHVNHANEINIEVGEIFKKLRESNVHLLNQTVLLKEINDSVDALIALNETLFSNGVLPYYLHVLDKVDGAAHFDIPLERAQSLHAGMSSRLPGYLVPRLVREVPGRSEKASIW